MAIANRVLYVDDEPDLLEIAKLFLEQSGEFSVDISESAESVLGSDKIFGYDAIISDYQMPGMDGISFLKAVREKHAGLPFILFTGRGREDVVIDAINNGADFYLQKGGEPVAQFAELAHKLRQAITRNRAQEDLRKAYDQIAASEEELREQFDELSRSEQQVRESETRFRELAELLPQIVFETDAGLQATFVNNQAYAQLGYSPEELASGFSAFTIFDPSQHAMIKKNVEKIIRGEPYTHGEYTVIRKDGSSFPALIYTNPAFRDGVVAGLRGIVVDISERKDAEDALRESEVKYRTLVEVNRDIVFSFDPDGTIRYMSPQTAEQTGFLPGEMVGRHFTEFIHPDDRAKLVDSVRIHQENGLPIPSMIFRLLRKDGTYGWYEDKTLYTLDHRKKPIFIGTIRDISERKASDDALFESRQMLQLVLDTIPQRVFWKDRNLVFLGCNKSLAADVGYSDPGLMIGKTDYDHSSARIAEQFRADDRLVMETGVPKINFEEPQIRPDGSTAWLRTSKVPLRNRNGEIIGVLGTYEDITETKRALLSLRESEEKYRDLADSLPMIVVEMDLDLVVTYANRYARETFGLSDAELDAGISALSFVENSQHARVSASIRELLDGKPFEPREYTARKRDGSLFPVIITSTPVYRDRTLTGFRGVVLDISARKKMEDDLRKSEEKFRSLVENATEIVFTLDIEGKFTYISPQWTWFLGHPTGEVLGHKAEEYIHPEDFSRNREIFRHVMRDGERVSVLEYRVRHKDGEWRWHSHSASPLRDASGTIVAYQGIAHDITERKRSEEALKRATKKLNLFSRITRHSINNQLQALDNLIDLLRKKLPDDSYDEYIMPMNATSRQIENLVRFTREYDRIGIEVPLWQEIRLLADQGMPASVPPGIAITNDLPAGLEIFSDPLVTRVISNLLDNAIRHGGRTTDVRVRFAVRDECGIITCEDNGIGIPASEKESIFRLAYGGNTGFGLAISREILDITGIAITENGEPGKGARFEIIVPKGAWRQVSSPATESRSPG